MKITTDEMIDAAEEYATAYDDDDRECIKADVMNAFYAGIRFALSKSTALPESDAASSP